MSKALIIIDIQNDYFEGGTMELHNPVKASENAKQVLEKSEIAMSWLSMCNTLQQRLKWGFSYPIQQELKFTAM